ncbi:MAG: protein kinase [Anaerolineae bacterium]|nr:protein kinase [Anaerolineae bacterium]
MDDNLSGQIIKSYEVKERIGEGGFGAVYRAIQSSIGREVAIKIILPQHANHPEFVRRFETEAQLVARLEHPHIVPLYDYWREPSGAYLVMRFLRGGSLRDSIEEHGAWDIRQVVQLINQIGAALTFAHQHSVIHRDLKSDNILIDEIGNAYLTDFGIAKDLGLNENLTGDAILGTPAYLSPEQIRGELATPQSDVYALGIMAYETLTATKPFFDATPATVLFKQLNEPLPNLTEQRPDLAEGINAILQRATSKDPDLRYESAIAFARDMNNTVRESLPGFPAGAPATLDVAGITAEEIALVQPVNPYKGLRAFQQADADDFYGRDALVEELLSQLSFGGERQDFLAVVGPSGSGKSSVVKAGMLPKIQNGVLNAEVAWYTAEMVPGTHPMEELEVALLAIATTEFPDLIDHLQKDERGLIRVIKRILPSDAEEFVLYIDQFEEVFTLVQDEDARQHFLNSILNAVEDERSRIKIIITMRADFYDRPLLYAQFGELIRRRTELVLPLSDKELDDAITNPAERVKVALEPGLVAAIVNDVNQQPGALPLLQYALTELFERRDGRQLTLAAYEEIGGTTGALARRAEELYQSFGDDEQAAARQMFLRLVNVGEGTEDTRRRIFQGELLSLNTENKTAMQTVIEQYGKYRLLTFDNDPQTRSSTVEVAHEALIRRWQRFRDWLDENRDSLLMQRRLISATEDWEQARRDSSFLARGTRLQQFEEWAASSDIALNLAEQQFLTTSIQAREEREAIERARQEREEQLEQQAKQRLRLIAVISLVAAIVGVVLAVLAAQARSRAVDSAAIADANAATATVAQGQALVAADNAATQAAIAEANALESRSLALAANARNALAANDPQLALALALESQSMREPAASEVLRTLSVAAYAQGPRFRFAGHNGSVTGVSFSADGQYSLSSSVDGTIRIWDNNTSDPVLLKRGAEDMWFNDVAMHPENDSFAAVGSDGLVYLWDFPSGALIATLQGHTDEIMTIAYSPDGNFILTGGTDHTIRLWDVESTSEVRAYKGHTGVVFKVAFSPDGSRFVSSSGDETLLNTSSDEVDRTVRIWDTESGEQIQVITPQSGFVRAVAYAPDGTTVALGVWDGVNGGTTRIYDVDTGSEIRRFFGHTTPLLDLAYSPDSKQIVSAAWDQNVRIWNIERGIEVQAFTGFGERILSMDFSQNGEFLLIGLGNIGDNEFAGTDRALDSSVWLWDIRSRDEVYAFDASDDWVWAVDISRDGQWAVTGGGPLRLPEAEDGQDVPEVDTLVRVWNIETGEIIQTMNGHSNTVDSVKFHPNGDWVLSSSWDGSIILWDIESGEIIRTYREAGDSEERVYMLDFTADGSQFISVGSGGTAILWDTETGDIIREFEHGVRINGVDISPDGTMFATATGNFGDAENLIYLWDIKTGDLIRTMAGHTRLANDVRFHPSGDYVVSTSWDDTVRLWDVATGEELRQFNGHNGHTFGIAFTSDGETMLTTSQDTTVRLWDFATGEELQRFNQHTNWIQEVVFTPDDRFAISAGQDNTARIWRINRTADQLAEFARNIRFIRDLTCSEREVYRLELCE